MHDVEHYKNCRTLGIAIKVTGDLLRPFLRENPSLENYVNTMRTPEDLLRFHPLQVLLELFEIAKKNNHMEQLAKSWALNVVREMRKQGRVSTPLTALHTIEAGFPRQHQGEVGQLVLSPMDDCSVTLIDSTYAPCGYISTFAKQAIANFGAVNITVTHRENGCRDQGGRSCEYQITWEESELLKMGKRIGGSPNA